MGKVQVIAVFFSLVAACAFETQSIGSGNGGLEGSGGSSGTTGGAVGLGGQGGGEPIVDGIPCTPATEAEDCPDTSCDPGTLECSTFRIGTRGACETCVSDSDCDDEDFRCVQMYYGPSLFPDANTGFCLEIAELDGPGDYDCDRPYVSVLPERPSRSNEGELHAYCGVNEALTTCFAVRAFDMRAPCPDGTECPVGGLCRTLGNGNNASPICTFECTVDRECPRVGGTNGTCGDYCEL